MFSKSVEFMIHNSTPTDLVSWVLILAATSMVALDSLCTLADNSSAAKQCPSLVWHWCPMCGHTNPIELNLTGPFTNLNVLTTQCWFVLSPASHSSVARICGCRQCAETKTARFIYMNRTAQISQGKTLETNSSKKHELYILNAERD